MGEFDFTYEFPNNFNKRVCQYLQQMQAYDVAEAFVKCKYEYENLGFAYYVGIKGDNWDKKAIDMTFEGPSRSIECLSLKKKVFKNVLEKAIKSSESGFVINKLFFIQDDTEILSGTNEDRLNADLENANKVLEDINQIGERMCLNYSYNKDCSENELNDYFRDMLFAKGYKEVKDQTRHGISVSGKEAGEVDILLTKDAKEIAIFEGLKLDSINKSYISTHINKAIINYNALGTATFIVSYVSVSDYKTFWEKFSAYIASYDFPLEVKRVYTEKMYPNASTRVGSIILSRDGYDFPVYFVAFKIG